MNLNISRSLMAFAIFVTLGLLASVGLKNYAFDKLKVNGPVYQDIVYGKDLIADILPPPLYIVESYMLANEVNAHPTIQEKNFAKIATLKDLYEERRVYWQESTLDPALNAKLQDDVLVKGDAYWSVMNDQYIPAVESGDANAALIALGELFNTFHVHDKAVNELVDTASTYLTRVETNAQTTSGTFSILTVVASAVSVLMFLGGLYMFRRRAVLPLTAMKDYMGKLSAGDYSEEVPYADRRDEIGEMAQSVAFFRQAALDRRTSRKQSEQLQAESLRQEQEAAERQAAADAERVRVIEALTAGLENLSAGNLTYRIGEAFAPDYEKLRTEFNASVEKLNETMQEIAVTTEAVRMSSSEIGSSADDLSKRTEQQAASLEETAAALDQITATVKSSEQRADEASNMVGATKAGTEKSAKVVQDAISAMEKIEESSGRISQIISVIDDIAFQTNLLALNAGVEAARAGEAGRGFAVVAQEVRELAGRSANAAKEIKTLIETSSTQVGAGVSLVNETGVALGEIEGQVIKINDHIRSIVTGAREQSTALSEINSAINQMDQVTQQNAAMVEETNAATQGLSSEAVKLESLVQRFKTGGTATGRVAAQSPARGNAPAPASANARPTASPARALGAKIASAFGGGASSAKKQEEQWDEF
ncbi:Methyl-accepting chemotaxis protein [Hoeflea phototrophica DFL-43]|uniref:Methyl-accepting chemotaxis protein n=1 Tax=Hoeflea phototrophica (strain DSM 17068 / NCIMB 14078 / DFL-43) TaxID=411684 RepID=A9D8R0_HOEPD|nr:HAMP domain-containing methyl-accepting chemotaxis protein [Hoeflea phototrophica]EDQ32775.2 Methyl-accepting chemotaxis protein [Hoeflea phototrophica DFL-43]